MSAKTIDMVYDDVAFGQHINVCYCEGTELLITIYIVGHLCYLYDIRIIMSVIRTPARAARATSRTRVITKAMSARRIARPIPTDWYGYDCVQ